MSYQTIVSIKQLAQNLSQPGNILLFDCSFDLSNPEAGRHLYQAGHLPGAFYLHLEQVLSGPKTGRNGRHPLPDPAALAAHLATLGAHDNSQIVAYDNAGGMYAARLWWLLRRLGHRQVAVLDGGLAAWQAAGHALSDQPIPAAQPGGFSVRTSLVRSVSHAEVWANLDSALRLLVDARAPDRFRGENETLDPVGGHIPGARNRLFRDNLAADGCFKSADQLRAEFSAVLGTYAPIDVIHQCGSGVTACHNLLAMELAGLSDAALYPGSWSEWSARPGAPIATGNEN